MNSKKLKNSGLVQHAEWFYLSTGASSGSDNMALDNYLLQALTEQKINKPLFRTYGWSEKTISIGKSQSNQLHFYKNYFQDCPVVPRITGGQAVIHDTNEITYSVFLYNNIGFKNIYYEIGKGLLNFLNQYGLVGEYGYSDGSYKTKFNCFESKSQSDIVVNYKKVIGSAQCRNKNFIMQHGSIKLDLISELCNKYISYEEAERDIKLAFEQVFGVEFIDFDLSSIVCEKIDLETAVLC